MYEVVLKDDRGKDTSTLNLTDQGKLAESHAKIASYLPTVANIYNDIYSPLGFKDLMNEVFSFIGKKINK